MDELETRKGGIRRIFCTIKDNFSFEKALNIAETVSKWCKNIARVLDEMIIPELKLHV